MQWVGGVPGCWRHSPSQLCPLGAACPPEAHARAASCSPPATLAVALAPRPRTHARTHPPNSWPVGETVLRWDAAKAATEMTEEGGDLAKARRLGACQGARHATLAPAPRKRQPCPAL